MPNSKNTTKKPSGTAPVGKPAEAQVEFQTLASFRTTLGAPDEEVRAELFDEVADDDLIKDGERVASENLVAGVVAYVASVLKAFTPLDGARRDEIIGFDPSFLPVLVDETSRLEALVARSRSEGVTVEVSLAERRARARATTTLGIARRDQAARSMRRVLRGQATERAALEQSVGNASTAAELASGLNFLAGQIDVHLASEKPRRVSLMKRVKLTPAYATRLRALAAKVLADDGAASAAVQTGVTQRALDLQDGRVLRVVDWVQRAFADANAVDGSITEPKLGDLEPLFVNTRRAAKPAPVAPPVVTTPG